MIIPGYSMSVVGAFEYTKSVM